MHRERLIKVWETANFGTTLGDHERIIFPEFLKIARHSENILEIGAGNGRMIRILIRHGVKARFYAVDITNNVREAPGVGIIADGRELPFKDNVFDFTYSLGVVEHFPETAQAIKEFGRVTKKGKYIIITTPHLSLDTLFRYLQYFFRLEWRKGTFEEVRGRNFSLSKMKYFFSKANLRVEKLGTSGSIRVPKLPFASKILNNLLSRKCNPFLYCVAKKL